MSRELKTLGRRADASTPSERTPKNSAITNPLDGEDELEESIYSITIPLERKIVNVDYRIFLFGVGVEVGFGFVSLTVGKTYVEVDESPTPVPINCFFAQR